MMRFDGAASDTRVAAERGSFVGRRTELATVLDSANRVREGESQGVLVEGAAGTGKTSLLGRVVSELTDFTVLRAICDPAETTTASGVIDQLLVGARPERGGASARPSDGERSGPWLLALLAALANRGPLAVVLDNVERADPSSARTLGFVLRRLRTERVLVLVTMHSDPPSSAADFSGDVATEWRRAFRGRDRLRTMCLTGLNVDEVAELLDRCVPGEHDGSAAQWLHHYTGGMPALLSALLPGLGDYLAPPGAPTLLSVGSPRVPDTVLSEVRGVATGIPEASRRVLSALAILDDRCPLAVVASVSATRDISVAMEPLVAAGFVGWEPGESLPTAAIRYPIYRDAVYQLLPPGRRRELHAAAARHVSGISVCRHRVAATGHTDNGLATELEDEAARYDQVGDLESAGKLLLWSSEATTDRAGRERRLLTAAHHFLACRKINDVVGLQARLVACPPSASRNLALGMVAEHAGRRSQARALLVQARRFVEEGDAGQPLGSHVDLALAMVSGQQDDVDTERGAATRILAARQMDPMTREWAQYFYADAAGRTADGPVTALRVLEDVSAVPTDAVEAARGCGVRLFARGMWHAQAGRLTEAADDLLTSLRSADEITLESIGPLARSYLAFTHFQLGNWRSAAAIAGQAVTAARSTATAWLRAPAHAIAACVTASRGDWQQAQTDADIAVRWQDRAGPDMFAAFPAVATAMIAQSCSDYRAMLAALYPLARRPRPNRYEQGWWRPLHVEALIGAGNLREARPALAELAAFAAATGRFETVVAWLDAWLLACEGEPARAAVAYEQANGRPGSADDVPMHRARLAHGYGQLLQSLQQRRPAVRWLREAHRLYTLLGARPYQERCEADLLRCGVTDAGTRISGAGVKASDRDALGLTARERRIAYLVARGLTNQEVGGEIHLSAKTVEYHLGNIFAKLDITSRRQLRSLSDGRTTDTDGDHGDDPAARIGCG